MIRRSQIPLLRERYWSKIVAGACEASAFMTAWGPACYCGAGQPRLYRDLGSFCFAGRFADFGGSLFGSLIMDANATVYHSFRKWRLARPCRRWGEKGCPGQAGRQLTLTLFHGALNWPRAKSRVRSALLAYLRFQAADRRALDARGQMVSVFKCLATVVRLS
jgi:hypothetical protein